MNETCMIYMHKKTVNAVFCRRKILIIPGISKKKSSFFIYSRAEQKQLALWKEILPSHKFFLHVRYQGLHTKV